MSAVEFKHAPSRAVRLLMLLLGVGVVVAAGDPPAAAAGWSIQTAPMPAHSDSWLTGVSCTSTRDCMAVGWSSAGLVGDPIPLVEHWNGTSWLMQRTPMPTTSGSGGALLAVSCTSSRACLAVGSSYIDNSQRPLAERWDGSSWSIQRTPYLFDTDQLDGVSCASTTDCLAVGYGQDAARWDGHRWRAQNIDVTTAQNTLSVGLQGVSCPSATTCAAVGGYDVLCGYDEDYSLPILGFWTFGRSVFWLRPNFDCLNSFGGPVLNAVSCTSTVACTAVGSVVDRWNGRRWSIQPARIPANEELNGVSCTSANACTAVGPDIYAWNGRASSRVTVPQPRGATAAWLNSVSCTSRHACVGVGAYQDHMSQNFLLVERER